MKYVTDAHHALIPTCRHSLKVHSGWQYSSYKIRTITLSLNAWVSCLYRKRWLHRSAGNLITILTNFGGDIRHFVPGWPNIARDASPASPAPMYTYTIPLLFNDASLLLLVVVHLCAVCQLPRRGSEREFLRQLTVAFCLPVGQLGGLDKTIVQPSSTQSQSTSVTDMLRIHTTRVHGQCSRTRPVNTGVVLDTRGHGPSRLAGAIVNDEWRHSYFVLARRVS